MKKLALIVSVLIIPRLAEARPYFRLMDPSHPIIGAGFLISPKSPTETQAVTDLALITHSTEDGTIIPERYQKYLPPVAWVPLQVGFGGSLTGNAVATIGSTANVAPVIAAIALRKVDKSSNPFLQGLKAALEGSSKGQIRLGGVLAGNLVKDGVFQSAKQMFPGRGICEIVGNASRIDFGAAWKF